MAKRVRTLLRVSSRQQLHDNDIPMQRAEAEQYIAKRQDWVFDKEYMEKAVSAYKNSAQDREVLQQILEDARKQEFDILLTYMSDRIGRQEEYSFYVTALNQLGIEVWTIKDGQLKTEEHIDKLLNYIRFWQNEGESRKTSMRVKDNQIELVKSGKFVGGKAPFGYQLVPSGEISNHGRLLKKLVIVDQDAAVVKKIYGLAVYQGMGYDRIAKTLNQEGIPAITTDKWKASTIAGILKNPIYMGYYAINRRINHGSFTRLDRKDWIYSNEQIPGLVIINRQMWERAQEIRETRKNKINASKEKSAVQYMEQYHAPFSTRGSLALAGLCYCGYCGRRLKNGSYYNHWTIKATGEKRVSFAKRYVCPEKCPERSCYSQGYLENTVFEMIENCMGWLRTIHVTEELQKIQKQQRAGVEKKLKLVQREQKLLKQDIETLEEKIPEAIRGTYCFSAEKLAEMIKAKVKALDGLEQAANEAKRKLQQADMQYESMEQFFHKEPNWKEEFQNADAATKKMLLFSMIDKIIVRDGDITIKFKIRLEDWCRPVDENST